MRQLKRQMFDIRQGEHLRTWSMFGYLLSVLFAYYIVKPVSRAMFLTKFDIDKLPGLYILIAIFGGFLAYLYSKLATKSSLRAAVLWSTVFWVASLLVMWWLIRMHLAWMIYVLNIWVSLFSIISVSQGWLVASNLFDTREAKRLYPLLGMGMVLGAAFGGEFTNRTAVLVGTENLLLASAVMVAVAYGCFRLSTWKSEGAVKVARAAQKEETDFSFTGMVRDVVRVRHLQIIVGMMVVMYLVDTLVEYQFQAMARTGYRGDQLTAFFGQFYGIYLNGIEFIFQLFVTSLVVRWLGVGGTLHIAPAVIGLSSVATIVAPGVASASAVRLTEASTRYTLNKTGMELLYMPLPLELRNRIKAFIDISVDRLSRGLAGVLLVVLTTTSLHMGVKGIAWVVVGLCVPWMLLSHLARREYVATVRRKLESRHLDLESTRLTVSDSETIGLLEAAAAGSNPRQASYALRLLAEAPNYDVRLLLHKLGSAADTPPQVRERIYEISLALKDDTLLERAIQELRAGDGPLGAAAAYALTLAPDRARLAAELLDDANLQLVAAAIEALRHDNALAEELIPRDWLERSGASPDPTRRRLAAAALGVSGDRGTELLYRLLDDQDIETARAACRSAGALKNRAYLFHLVQALGNARLRGDAFVALASFGPAICGFLSDCLLDQQMPMRVRREVPRVLKNIVDQRSVDVLLTAIDHEDLAIRSAVLKALNRLREANPQLNFAETFVNDQILREARYYYQLNAALAPFRDVSGHAATRLLALTIEERLRHTLERLFRLLGLRYPPKSIYSAYLAVQRQSHEEATAAIEFLDNVLSRDLKRVLLPLLDAPEHVLEHGRDLFGVDLPTAEAAIRELLHSHDPWLVACSMAAAAEMQLRRLAPEIAQAGVQAEAEVSEVARCAGAALAA
ncbi:MAG TPA: Npt1/Npt2 family nucleotide transporter [Bryobacteraceae bacterium]|nr:Npt1/Npt2 family nucleotide transporter [Bryobacteraceae bacterium]